MNSKSATIANHTSQHYLSSELIEEPCGGESMVEYGRWRGSSARGLDFESSSAFADDDSQLKSTLIENCVSLRGYLKLALDFTQPYTGLG